MKERKIRRQLNKKKSSLAFPIILLHFPRSSVQIPFQLTHISPSPLPSLSIPTGKGELEDKVDGKGKTEEY